LQTSYLLLTTVCKAIANGRYLVMNPSEFPKDNCLVYMRRSQDREDRQAYSIPKQDAQVKQIIARHNHLNPVYLPAEERSARHPGRPIFNDMMDRIEAGEARYIATWAISRLSRNPVDGGRIIYALDQGKLLAIYTPGRVYRNTSDDKLILHIELGLAKKNNDDLSVQVKEGFEAKREHGEYPGPAPLGYLNAIISPGHRNIVPNPDTAPMIKDLFAKAASGKYLLDDLWRYALSIGLKSRTGGTLAKQTLIDTLKRRLYTGIYKYGGDEWHVGTYEPLISADLYDQVQIAMGWAEKIVRPATTSGRFYMYKGIPLCETCLFNITAYTKIKTLADGSSAEYVYYTCTKKNKAVKCTEPQISEEELTVAITSGMAEYEISEANAATCKQFVRNLYDDYVKNRNRYIEVWQREQRQAEKALEVLDDKLEAGTITDERYKLRAAKHEATIARTTEQLNKSSYDAERWLELSDEVFSDVTNIGSVFKDATDEERRQLMLHLGSNWTLGNKKVAFTPRKPLDVLHVGSRNPEWRARPDSNRRSPP
jgi:site-specific DNA recombinase